MHDVTHAVVHLELDPSSGVLVGTGWICSFPLKTLVTLFKRIEPV